MHNLGFKTFGQFIDESFDSIENPLDRCARISEVVEDLCHQDLSTFVTATADICEYNQQHLAELQPKIRSELLARFIQFVNEHYPQ